MQYTDEEKNILRHISYYYYYVIHDGINLVDAVNSLSRLYITNLSYKDSDITITLGRPGYLIGHYGKNLTALQKYLSEQMNKEIKIKIVENNIIDYLIGYNSLDYNT